MTTHTGHTNAHSLNHIAFGEPVHDHKVAIGYMGEGSHCHPIIGSGDHQHWKILPRNECPICLQEKANAHHGWLK